MKNLYCLLLALCFSISAMTQSELFWTDAIPVTSDNTFGNRAPRIVLSSTDEPIVYWGKTSGAQSLYIATLENDAFSAPVAINTAGIDADLWGAGLGPQIASFGNMVYLVFEEYGAGIYCVRSTDGGASFEMPVTVFIPPAGRFATIPNISIDLDGNPIVSFITTNAFEQEALFEVSVSLDEGLTFEPTSIGNLPVPGGEVCECCPAVMGVSTENDYLLVFRNNDNNIRDVWAAKSSDGGANFTEATDLDDTDWQVFQCPSSGPDAAVFGDSLATVFFSGAGGKSSVYLSTMSIGNMEKGIQIDVPTLDANASNQNYPRIAGNGDTLGLVWQESINGDLNVRMAWSANGTANLLEQTAMAADGNFSQRYPDIAFRNGIFHIVYEDQISGRVWYRKAAFEPFTSIHEDSKSNLTLQISPNPAKEYVFLEIIGLEQAAMVEMINNQGRVIEKRMVNSAQTIWETSSLPDGVYFFRAILDGKVLSKKVIVQ